MIASGRGLAVLAAIAVALLVLVLVSGPRGTEPADRSLVPGFDADRVVELQFRHGDQRFVVRRAGDEWRIPSSNAVADPAAVDAVFTALRGGRWHRRASRGVAGATRATLVVGGTTFDVGVELPGTGQTWLVRDGSEALLVDSWIAAALSRDELAMRERHPLDCASASAITAVTAAGTLRIEGSRLVEPRPMWLDDGWLASLADACARVEIRSLAGKRTGTPGLRVVANGELMRVGTCTDRSQVYVETGVGAGCVAEADLDALTDALRDPVVDRHPLPIEPAMLVLADGRTLELTGSPHFAGGDADPDRVRELVAALRAPGNAVVARPTAKPAATLIARDRTGLEITLELWDHVIARAGEPSAIAIDPVAWTTITRPTSLLRDPTLWREDATTISAVTIDGVTYRRGAVLGEWTREPAGVIDAGLVDALVEALATVRAPAGPPPHVAGHRLTVTITPPAGSPVTHTLEVGAQAASGCAARVDGKPVVLPLPLCTAVLALASSR